MNELSVFKRPLAITDLEMTGLDPRIHEIVEIGLLVVDQDTFEIKDTMDVKVLPEHIETANARALEVCGYKPEDWTSAIPLKDALAQYVQKTAGALFCAHNMTFDWAFLEEGFRKTGITDTMDYHRIDVHSVAWGKLRGSGIEKLRLSALCEFLGIPKEPEVHRGINGARSAYEVLKKLMALK